MKTTLGKIKPFVLCSDGWEKLCRNIGSADESTEVSLSQILDSNGVQDAFRSLRCWDYRDYCLLLADVIEPVLPFNGCYAVVNMSNTIRKWHAGEITDNDLAAARGAAGDAACDAEGIAAKAAAWAARAAAGGMAAWAAAWAAKTAAWAARDAAWAAAWGRSEKLMREFIEKEQTNENNTWENKSVRTML